MTKTRTLILFLVAGAAGFSFPNPVYPALCDAIVGKWAWFIGGDVTVNPDGTFVQQSGNGGTWECSDTSSASYTLKWRIGGYVNRLALSADGNALSSTDPSQQFVSAKRISAGGTAQSDMGASPLDPILATQPDGERQLAKDLPELMYAATKRAQLWRQDACPVSLEFEHFDAPNPKLTKGPQVVFLFSSLSEGTGFRLTVTTAGVSTFIFSQPVNWGDFSLPPVFVDLPAALRIARENGMKGPLENASLRIYSPKGAPPVLAWMLHSGSSGGGKTINGATGEIIDYDVTGYIADYNAQWERAAKGLRALLRSARGGSSGSGGPAWPDSDYPSPGSDKPYDDGSAAREEHERNAAEGRAYWSPDPELYNRVKNGECTWNDSSNIGC